MKIIFKDELEKEFLIGSRCPEDIIKHASLHCYGYIGSPHKCRKCWETNIEMEVEENVED